MEHTMIDRITKAVIDADAGKSELNDFCLKIEGASSRKIRHFLNNLVTENDSYLEIGCFKGSTLISALYPKKCKKYFAIDNYCQFPPELGPDKTRAEFIANFQTAFGEHPNYIDKDCFSFDPFDYGIQDINIYLFDGEHTYMSQYKALTHYYKCLTNDFVLLVDDWATNGWGVREGTLDAIRDLGLKINTRLDMPPRTGEIPAELDDQWWFGFGILHLSKI